MIFKYCYFRCVACLLVIPLSTQTCPCGHCVESEGEPEDSEVISGSKRKLGLKSELSVHKRMKIGDKSSYFNWNHNPDGKSRTDLGNSWASHVDRSIMEVGYFSLSFLFFFLFFSLCFFSLHHICFLFLFARYGFFLLLRKGTLFYLCLSGVCFK